MSAQKEWAERNRIEAAKKVCDYHDLPLVCGECSYFDGFPTQTPEKHDAYWRIQSKFHAFRPVHRIPDPEGIEGTQIVPCGLAP